MRLNSLRSNGEVVTIIEVPGHPLRAEFGPDFFFQNQVISSRNQILVKVNVNKSSNFLISFLLSFAPEAKLCISLVEIVLFKANN